VPVLELVVELVVEAGVDVKPPGAASAARGPWRHITVGYGGGGGNRDLDHGKLGRKSNRALLPLLVVARDGFSSACPSVSVGALLLLLLLFLPTTGAAVVVVVVATVVATVEVCWNVSSIAPASVSVMVKEGIPRSGGASVAGHLIG
jgi:hypothetical protein